MGKFDLHKPSPTWGLDGKGDLDTWGFTDGCDSEGKWDCVGSGRIEPAGPYAKYLHDHGLMEAHAEDFKKRREGGYAATHATPLPEEAYCDNWVADKGLQVLESIPVGQPWFLQVNFTGPHEPLDVTERMKQSVMGREMPQPVAPKKEGGYDAATHADLRRNYTSMCENIDRHLGRYLQLLEERGELARTLVVFASDHGEMLGDYGFWSKCRPHEASVRVPMVIAGPGTQAGQTRHELILLQDLTETFLDLAGRGSLPRPAGRSLRPLLAGEKPGDWRTQVRCAFGDWSCEIGQKQKTVHLAGGEETCTYAVNTTVADPGLEK